MVTDTISDLVVRIKNAGCVSHPCVEVPYSKLKHAVVRTLQLTKFIQSFDIVGEGSKKRIMITLAYDEHGTHKVHDVHRLSKPGKRVYAHAKDFKPFKNGKGKVIVSTPKGIMTGEEAKKEMVGGEVLFTIW
ncbi:MAG: 30S ribosomal protein S8 [Alphaproteobacteria bacterium]|nr:30S ribosomal protein S8 [Alphaproteobacteria bacterium]